MALPSIHPILEEAYLAEGTTSIATTPIPAVMVSPITGIIASVLASAGGTTTGAITVTVTVNGGSDVTSGQLQIPAGTGARNNPSLSLAKVGVNSVQVQEGDLITFTPSGGTGTSIPGAFSAAIRQS
jgi:hypothetical protein